MYCRMCNPDCGGPNSIREKCPDCRVCKAFWHVVENALCLLSIRKHHKPSCRIVRDYFLWPKKRKRKSCRGIRLLDSGNYHYMSKLLLGLEKEDLFLAVFDHHTDMQPPALLPVLSCGSWIRDAAGAYQNIKGICVIGPPEASVRETEAMEHVWFVTQEELDDGSGAAKIKEIFASHAGTFPVYLSVDKDILSKGSQFVSSSSFDRMSLSTDRYTGNVPAWDAKISLIFAAPLPSSSSSCVTNQTCSIASVSRTDASGGPITQIPLMF